MRYNNNNFYSSSCLGLEAVKGPFGLWVKLPPAHLSTTKRMRFPTVSFNFLTLDSKTAKTNFCSFWLDPTTNRTQVYRFSNIHSINSTTDWTMSTVQVAFKIYINTIQGYQQWWALAAQLFYLRLRLRRNYFWNNCAGACATSLLAILSAIAQA